MKLRCLLLCFVPLLIIGCAHQVPLKHELELSSPPDKKIDKKILLVIPAKHAALVINHKPDPLADTYVFAGGPSLKGTLQDVLSQLYRETDFAHALPSGGGDYDLAVVVDFQSWDIILNIYTGNVVTLGINYSILDGNDDTLSSVPTKTSSKDQYSGGDLTKTFIFGAFYNIGKMEESSGGAWNAAMVNSIGLLLDKLLSLEKMEAS